MDLLHLLFFILSRINKKSIEEYTKKRTSLFSIIKFDINSEQLDVSVQENLCMVKAQLDEIKQNNSFI